MGRVSWIASNWLRIEDRRRPMVHRSVLLRWIHRSVNSRNRSSFVPISSYFLAPWNSVFVAFFCVCVVRYFGLLHRISWDWTPLCTVLLVSLERSERLPNKQSVCVSCKWTCHRHVTMKDKLAGKCVIKVARELLAVHWDVKLNWLFVSLFIDWPHRCLAVDCVRWIGVVVLSTSDDWSVDKISIDDDCRFRWLEPTFEVSIFNKVLKIPRVEFHVNKEFIRNISWSLTLVGWKIENRILEIMKHDAVVCELVVVNRCLDVESIPHHRLTSACVNQLILRQRYGLEVIFVKEICRFDDTFGAL